jgi:hypothetical protein
MADPVPIVVPGGGSRIGETLIILGALALAAWFIFRRKPADIVVSPESAVGRPPRLATTTGASSVQRGRPLADVAGRAGSCPPGQLWDPRLNRGAGGCTTPQLRAAADALEQRAPTGAELLASIQRPPPVTVPQGATAAPPPLSVPSAGAASQALVVGASPVAPATTSYGKPAPVTIVGAPALKPAPLTAPFVVNTQTVATLSSGGIRKSGSSAAGGALSFARAG